MYVCVRGVGGMGLGLRLVWLGLGLFGSLGVMFRVRFGVSRVM